MSNVVLILYEGYNMYLNVCMSRAVMSPLIYLVYDFKQALRTFGKLGRKARKTIQQCKIRQITVQQMRFPELRLLITGIPLNTSQSLCLEITCES